MELVLRIRIENLASLRLGRKLNLTVIETVVKSNKKYQALIA